MENIFHSVSNDPLQNKSFEILKNAITQELRQAERLIALRKINNKITRVDLTQGSILIDKAFIIIRKMQLREHNLLVARRQNLNDYSSYVPILIVFAAILSVIITVFFYNKVKNDLYIKNTLQRERQMMERKDEFLSIASHELKTPITSVKGYLQIIEMLSAKEGNLKYRHIISKASNQLHKLIGLVNDLLNVSKIQAGKLDFHFSTFSMAEIVEDVLNYVHQSSPSCQISVKGNPAVFVKGDRDRIEQVLNNLITNGIKYSPDAKELILGVEQTEDQFLEVSVTDFGIGIPEEKQEYIFNKFSRVNDNSNYASGLGLGLYISSEIVKRHHGQISVKSTLGKGSRFSFTIPLHTSATELVEAI
jgi:signal transduction histidine kinase